MSKQADEQKAWVTEQVRIAFERISRGEARFIPHREAKNIMEKRKSAIRKRISSASD